MKTLYRKSTKTSSLINQEQDTPSLPVPLLSPHVRIGLYRLATGRSVTLGSEEVKQTTKIAGAGAFYPIRSGCPSSSVGTRPSAARKASWDARTESSSPRHLRLT